jgi:hypothetical protein
MLEGKMPDHGSFNGPVDERPHDGKNDDADCPQRGLGNECGHHAGSQRRDHKVSNQHLGSPTEAAIQAPEIVVAAMPES